MMKEIRPDIFLVPGENKSQFPFCTCLYLRGKTLRVLIDAGMGGSRMDDCLRKGVDVLILTHCHYDHRSTIGRIPEIPVWCHVLEAPYLRDRNEYLRGIGMIRSGIDTGRFFKKQHFPGLRIERTLADGEKIDLGGMTLQAIHSPGHTPGHLAFYIPEADFLFTADVALNLFGPFYGNDFSSIDAFVQSIRNLKSLQVSTVATSHSGPFSDRLPERFDRYENLIYKKDDVIVEALSETGTLADLTAKNLFFPAYPEPREIMVWMERVEIEKHLERLLGLGKIRKEGDRYGKTA